MGMREAPGEAVLIRRLVGALILGSVAAFVTTGCGTASSRADHASHVPTAGGDVASAPALAADWRRESFGGVEVAVPAEWRYGSSTGQVTTQWCVSRGGDQRREPVVARPGVQTLVDCGGTRADPDPGTLIERAGVFVAFGQADREASPPRHEGDRTTVIVNGVTVLVQAEPRLRQRIVGMIRSVHIDSSGCPVIHPVDEDASLRPDPPVDVASLARVTEVAACKYGIDPGSRRASLLSSVLIGGERAQAAIGEIAEAPLRGGPDAPATCSKDASYGNDLIVLPITSEQQRNEVFLRYSGCDHNGFDDGRAVRSLTADAVAPLISGPNAVSSFDGGNAKRQILHPNQTGDGK